MPVVVKFCIIDFVKVYFVRHGESEFNTKNLHQHAEVPLTEKGLEQASFIAKRIAGIRVDHMFASPYLRARQTAEIIAKKINKKIEFSDLIVELHRPSELVGYSYTDPFALEIKKKIKEHLDDAEWHYSDEENFYDFKRRAEKFIALLEKRFDAENVLVVTHGHITRMIMAVMFCKVEQDLVLSPELFHRFETFYMTRNTGITLCEKKSGKDWKLLTWNDHAHLGDVRQRDFQ